VSEKLWEVNVGRFKVYQEAEPWRSIRFVTDPSKRHRQMMRTLSVQDLRHLGEIVNEAARYAAQYHEERA